MSGLNDNQKRHLRLTFQHVDDLLAEALKALACSESPSPFQRYRPDSLPVQRKVLADYVARLRGLMAGILAGHDVALPEPQISSLWAFQAALMSARIDIEELAPKRMRGYGSLSDDAAGRLEAELAQVADVLDRMSEYLARGAGQDLQARLDRLEKTAHEVEIVKAIERVVTAHGLVELRPFLDAMVERLESPRFEIAVFGRVSSGKSSLLNHILKTDVLPVGVTPVTAIPTRVVFGPRPAARIWFAEGKPATVDLHELAQYVTERGNPDNARHVTRIQVELPADRLDEGVTFVDTPGLGSLARYGQMESLAYLPRCDLGIVLVDASSTLLPEDAAIVNALRQAGADVMVLLAKADALAEAERPAAAQYVGEQLRASLGFDVPLDLVSVKGADAALCDRWFDNALLPRLRRHAALAAAALRRKVGLLREATVAALRRRLDASAVEPGAAGKWAAAQTALNEALARLDAAAADRTEWPGLTDRILAAAARSMSDAWRGDGVARLDAAAFLAAAGGEQMARLADAAGKSLARLRAELQEALQAAAAAVGAGQEAAAEIPVPSGLPILDLAAGLPAAQMRRPWPAILSPRLASRIARSRLSRQFGPRLAALLEQHVRQLDQWRLRALDEMRRSFTARADLYRAQGERGPDGPDRAAIERDIKWLESI